MFTDVICLEFLDLRGTRNFIFSFETECFMALETLVNFSWGCFEVEVKLHIGVMSIRK